MPTEFKKDLFSKNLNGGDGSPAQTNPPAQSAEAVNNTARPGEQPRRERESSIAGGLDESYFESDNSRTLMFFQRHLAPAGQLFPPWTWTAMLPSEVISATFALS